MSNNIVLSCFLKIGDRVKMNRTDNSCGWDTNVRKPNGTCGVVVGFHQYFTFYDVSTAKGKKLGKYRCNGAPYVLWDDGDSDLVTSHDIQFEDIAYKHPEVNSAYCKAFSQAAFVEDLPALPLMVGNLVSLKDDRLLRSYKCKEFVIESIQWHYVGEKCYDGITDYPIYQIGLKDGSGPHISVIYEELIFCGNGNYWAWLNDKSQLSFQDIKEEIRFYESLGKVNPVIQPKTGDYCWDINDAVAAIKAGTIDILCSSDGLFGSASFPTAYKVDEDINDLGERCRAAFKHED